jgi:hypothetical protein
VDTPNLDALVQQDGATQVTSPTPQLDALAGASQPATPNLDALTAQPAAAPQPSANARVDGAPLLAEVGSTGLKRFSGYVREEWHKDLIGVKGIRAYREMADNHPIISAMIWVLELLARRVEYFVEETGDTPEHQIAKALCESATEDVDGGLVGVISEALTMLPYGWSYLEKVFKISRGDSPIEELKSKFDDGMVRWRKLRICSQDSLLRWEFGPHGELLGMWQLAPPHFIQTFVPREKALLFRLRSNKDNPEGRSMLRGVYTSYYFEKNHKFTEAVGVERNIAGIPDAQVPPEIMHPDASAEQKAIRREWENLVRDVRMDARTGIVRAAEETPDGKKTGYKFQLLSASGRSFADTDPIIKRYRSEIAVGMLCEVLLLGIDGKGSHALSKDKTDFFALAAGAVIDAAIEPINREGFPELCRLNGIDPCCAPVLKRGNVQEADLGVLGAFLQQAGAAGFIVPDQRLEEALREEADLPAPEQRPEASAAPTPPANPNVPQLADDRPQAPGLLDDRVSTALTDDREGSGAYLVP